MKQKLLALLLIVLLVPFTEAVLFRTGASDGAVFPATGVNTPIPSTITVVPAPGEPGEPAVTLEANIAPSFAANFNVKFNTVYDVTYVSPGYTTDTDDFYFDSKIQNCVRGSNCNMLSEQFSTVCNWNATFNDWFCRVTDTRNDQWITYIYNKNDPRFGEVIRSFNLMYPFVPGNNDPVLNPIGNKVVNEGQLLTFTISGSDPNNDPITFDTGNVDPLPRGATFNGNTRTFSWTPDFTQSGTYTVKFFVRDPFGAYDSEEVTIRVVDVAGVPTIPPAGNQPPVITSSPVLNAFPNKLYTYDVNAFDPEGAPLTFSLEQAPANMTINTANGLIRWTPSSSQLGSHSVTVAVTDGIFVVRQRYNVKVSFGISDIARRVLRLMRIIPAGECYEPGSSVSAFVSADNLADAALKEVKLTASIPELGIRMQSSYSNVKEDRSVVKQLLLELPDDAPEGEYYVRLVMSNDDVRRVKERPIIIAENCGPYN